MLVRSPVNGFLNFESGEVFDQLFRRSLRFRIVDSANAGNRAPDLRPGYSGCCTEDVVLLVGYTALAAAIANGSDRVRRAVFIHCEFPVTVDASLQTTRGF